jgi:serine/threonine protein phosphatase 1
MTGPTIARLSDGGCIWALGAQQGNDRALEVLAGALLQRWQRGDKLVVLGNMLGGDGDPGRALDLMLLLRRRLLATNLACDVFFLRGAQEEMWHKLLALQFAMSPLAVLDWMLPRGLAATIEAYGGNVEEGRIACRTGPKAIARWTVGLRQAQMARAGHAELLNSLMRAALSADGTMLLSAAGVDATRPIDDQADAFWWNGQTDRALDTALANGTNAGWQGVMRLVRGAGPGEATDEGRVLTVTRQAPALVALDASGAVLERIES